MVNNVIPFTPLGFMRSPYKQKFAIPRQPNLVREAVGEIHFLPEYADANGLRDLDSFSHLWLLFVFHESADQGWSATVSPPRLGGNKRTGVFATRSMFRPNPIGLSVVEYDGWEQRGQSLVLTVRGIDMLDGTPILDIKPYLPYADMLPHASGGFAQEAPPATLSVWFSNEAQVQLAGFVLQHPELEAFIRAVLQQDPRPAQHVRQQTARSFAMRLYDLNIRWRVKDAACEVLSIERWSGTD
ncbi:MAG TPA: tRNA (N6-threonylcarbamoyladenosine(37)-N6)-methyltransferase TrmO [Pseudomonadaceae bacterium]|nr:tRNA (N6-threonylcarbamoyladenosine(37)-N6)-methyltransferase TrmO [Pseudomonadaceae bacterium]